MLECSARAPKAVIPTERDDTDEETLQTVKTQLKVALMREVVRHMEAQLHDARGH